MKASFHKLTTFLDIVSSRILFVLSLLVPRDKKLWVFIGWHRTANGEIFADNTKYLYLHVSQKEKDLKPVWLAKNEVLARELQKLGYRSFYEGSPAGIWCALRAGYTVIDAFIQRKNFRWMGRTKIVQLLHGKGMKKHGYEEKPMRRQNYIFNTSDYTRSLIPEIFKEGAKEFVTGYSRNDVLFEQIPGSEIGVSAKTVSELAKIRRDFPDSKIFWYSPTFRRGHRNFEIEKILHPEILSAWLERNRAYLFVSLHPKYREQARQYSFPRIFFFEESDVYPLMRSFDAIICDYSSIFADFLLTDKPMIFYPYDIEEYNNMEGLSTDYDSITPGRKAYDPEQLILAMEEVAKGIDSFKKERKLVRQKYHKFQDGNSSERIMSVIRGEKI